MLFRRRGTVTTDAAQHRNARRGGNWERDCSSANLDSKRSSAEEDAANKLEFERLYRESYELVYNYVRYRMADEDAAEDVVSEAYLLAARSFWRFDPKRAKFSTWVIAIATNCMNSYYRKTRPTVMLDDVPEHVVSVPGGQDEVDNRAVVDALLGVLSAEERELVILKYREGYRNVDIAKKLDMNASTVSTKLASALSKMREAGQRL